MTRVNLAARRTFAALRFRNYRLYFFGQIVSVTGTWMQSVAQAWLVFELTHSGTWLGAVLSVQFLPVLLAGPWGGVVADRVDKRRLLLATQTVSLVLAGILGVLTVTNTVELWMVFVLAAGLGLVNAIDNPARQTFVLEMVGPDELTNAVSLNSVVVNAARVVGPAVAGVLIATVGIGQCFLLNAASYVAVIIGLVMMRPGDLFAGSPALRARGQLRDGLRYVWSTAELRIPLLMMALIGTLAYEFSVSLPLFAENTFHAGAGAFGAMSSMMGAGAVIGGLAVASGGKGAPSFASLSGAAMAFGVLMLGLSASPNLPIAYAVLPIMGGASIAFIAMANSTLQLRADPSMRGRVMALYGVAFIGSTPIGGPIVGWIGQHYGARSAIAVGGAATVVAAAYGWALLVRRNRGDVTLAPAGAGG